MRRHSIIIVVITVLLVGTLGADIVENFDDWTDNSYDDTSMFSGSPGEWEGFDTITDGTYARGGSGKAVMFDTGNTGEDQYLLFGPAEGQGMNNGIGTISFYYRTDIDDSVVFIVEYSQGGETWNLVEETPIMDADTTYRQFSSSLQMNGEDIKVRIRRMTATGGSAHLIIDDMTITDYIIPEFTDLSLRTSPDSGSTWETLNGDLDTGFELVLDNENAEEYFIIGVENAVTNVTLDEGLYPFTLSNHESLDQSFYDWWAEKNVTQTYAENNPASWQAMEWEIINGNQPTFYLKVDASGNVSIIDGLQSLVGGGEQPLVMNRDYPELAYEYTGTITADGVDSESITVGLSVDSIQSQALDHARANTTLVMDETADGDVLDMIDINAGVTYPEFQAGLASDLRTDILLTLSEPLGAGTEISLERNGVSMGTYTAAGGETTLWFSDITGQPRELLADRSNTTDIWTVTMYRTASGSCDISGTVTAAEDGAFDDPSTRDELATDMTSLTVIDTRDAAADETIISVPPVAAGEEKNAVELNIAVNFGPFSPLLPDFYLTDTVLFLRDGSLFPAGITITATHNGTDAGQYITDGTEDELLLADLFGVTREMLADYENAAETWNLSFTGNDQGSLNVVVEALAARDGEFRTDDEQVMATTETVLVIISSAATWHQGDGAPDDADGRDGDLYIDSETGAVYEKQNGSWVEIGNISGTDGSDVLVSVSDEDPGTNCTTGGKKIESGRDIDGDDNLDPGEVEETMYICNGTDGTDGDSGTDSLVKVSDESAGDNCSTGGKKIETGQDTDNDGVLDDDEVTHTEYVCDGADGESGEQGPAGSDGSDGTAGNDGTDGDNALVATADEPAGENCSEGGVKIMTGIDSNGDDTLDEDEIDEDQTTYLCNGSVSEEIAVSGGGGCSLTRGNTSSGGPYMFFLLLLLSMILRGIGLRNEETE